MEMKRRISSLNILRVSTYVLCFTEMLSLLMHCFGAICAVQCREKDSCSFLLQSKIFLCSSLQCNARWFCAVHFNAMQDGFVQFISMQCKMILCSNCTAVHYNSEWWSCGTGSTWQGVKGRYPTIIHPLTIRIFIEL